MTTIFQKRQQRLARSLQKNDIAALLVTHAANRYYLSGFELHDPQCNESAGALLVTREGEAWLLTDSRYKDAATRLWPEERIFIYAGGKDEHIASWIHDLGIRTLAIEAVSMPVVQYKILEQKVDLVPTKNLVENLRIIKDNAEIQALKQSCSLNHHVFSQLESLLVPGMTEADLAWKIERLFREQGASELSFETIVAVGPNSALPHAIPGSAAVTRDCPVLVDMGCRLNGYCSDQTRTFWVGDTPSKAFLDTLKRVQEAQQIALEHYKPGEPIKHADQAARSYFDKHGQSMYFTHSLGHGVGLETHEPPAISPRAQTEFRPGMVVTAEPGLYYTEWGGVRWEHMVLITEDGHEVL
ncbi:M24 family metallopeptidase [Desulfoplanes sp. PS50]|jgi:Xaa-Pro aminopeptidase